MPAAIDSGKKSKRTVFYLDKESRDILARAAFDEALPMSTLLRNTIRHILLKKKEAPEKVPDGELRWDKSRHSLYHQLAIRINPYDHRRVYYFAKARGYDSQDHFIRCAIKHHFSEYA